MAGLVEELKILGFMELYYFCLAGIAEMIEIDMRDDKKFIDFLKSAAGDLEITVQPMMNKPQ